jgi:hypothetical protein
VAVLWTPGGLGVVPVVGFPSTEADRRKAANETGKATLLLSKPSAGQVALLRHLAQTSPEGRYVVPTAEWIDTILKVTKGLSEGDVMDLQALNWSPAATTLEDLRKSVLGALKTKQAPAPKTPDTRPGDDRAKKRRGASD